MGRFGWAFGLAVVAGASACGYESMHPGDACGRCHAATGTAPAFGLAGTVFGARGTGLDRSKVHVTDATGRDVELETNAAGNFFTRRPLTPPLRVTLTKDDASASTTAAPSGDCNACHTGSATGPGRLALTSPRRP